MARQCTQPKRPQNSAWFMEKILLVQAQEAGQVLDEKHVMIAPLCKVFEEITNRVAKYNAESIQNKNVNESLTAELERYKERIKELENIVFKVGQSAQTMHMLTKPQVFYDDTHKQALGYQNPFYLKKAQWIKPTLYDDVVISKQAFRLPISNPISEQLIVPPTPVKIEVPSELPKVILVNKSFQKLKNHLAKFDKVVKERTTALAITEGTWGFKHTKEVFITHVILFLNSLRESFKDFDNGLHDELNEVKMIFNQMVATIEQCSVDKKCFEILKKELLENDQLLELIISQDLVHTALNSLEVIDECQSIRKSYCREYNRNLTLEAELQK
ncbi:hypothetical protein Tco_0522375 [Tanacetum coccineum]